MLNQTRLKHFNNIPDLDWPPLLNFIRNFWKTNNIKYSGDRIAYFQFAMDYLFTGPYKFPVYNKTLCAGFNETCGLNLEVMKNVLLPTDCTQFISNVKYLGKKLNCRDIFIQRSSQGVCFIANGIYGSYGKEKSNFSSLTFTRADYKNRIILSMEVHDFNGAQMHVRHT